MEILVFCFDNGGKLIGFRLLSHTLTQSFLLLEWLNSEVRLEILSVLISATFVLLVCRVLISYSYSVIEIQAISCQWQGTGFKLWSLDLNSGFKLCQWQVTGFYLCVNLCNICAACVSCVNFLLLFCYWKGSLIVECWCSQTVLFPSREPA